jgi:hypothetical protein
LISGAQWLEVIDAIEAVEATEVIEAAVNVHYKNKYTKPSSVLLLGLVYLFS